MMSFIRAIVKAVLPSGRRFRSEAGGNVAIIFAFASVAIVLGVGAGIDLSGAYSAKQKLSQVAALTCQYSVRTSVVNVAANPGNTFQTYLTTVNTFAKNSLTAQGMNSANVTGGASGGSYFYALNNPQSGPYQGVTDLNMSYPTAFLKIANYTSFPIHAHINCQNAANTQQVASNGSILKASFETNCSSYCFTLPSGEPGILENPTTTFGSMPTYVDPGGFSFYVIGYCLEDDAQGVINASDPDGTHSVELDCDNASGTAGNSSISTRVYLSAGNYELRYFYRSRVDQSALDPFYVCGWSYNDPTKTDDLSWVNQTNFPTLGTTSAMRTNQMNVYLDPTTSSAYPPLHYTNYSNTPTQQLAGSNLIDSCVYAYKWVERSITINVSASGYFWLSFAADGQNDSYGAQLDDIQLCPGTCSGAPQDNFPSTTPQTLPPENDQSVSIAGKILLLATPASSGWNNYSGYFTPMCTPTSCSTSTPSSANTDILLDPGFYELTYQYKSLATFTNPTPPVTGCDYGYSTSTIPGNLSQAQGTSVNKVKNSFTNSTYAAKADVDVTGAFVLFPGQTLSPNIGGSVTTSNPLLDVCYYNTDTITRTVSFQVTKPGYYDLNFVAAGSEQVKLRGGGIVVPPTGVIIKAIGSPYQYATSTGCPLVPVPNPQVGSPIMPAMGSGFTTTATDPFLQGGTMSACAAQ